MTADLKLESAAFIRDLTKASQATQRNTNAMRASMAQLQRGFAAASTAFKSFAAGFVSVAAVRSIANMGRAAVQTADEIATASTKIGIAAEQLQRFRFAAAQADVETAQLDTALRMFAQNLATGKIAAEGQNIASAFRNYIEQIANAPTQLEKVRLAQEAFGRQWQTALLLAAQGAEEFRRQADSAFVWSDRALKAAGELDNQFRAMRNAVEAGFGTGFIEEFSGAVGTSQAQLQELNRTAEEFGRVSAAAFRAATQGVIALAAEMAESRRQTQAYITLLQQWREGQIGLGDLARGLLDPRGAMRQNDAITQSTEWWRNAAQGAKAAGDAAAGAADELGTFASAADKARLESEAFWKSGMKVIEEPIAPHIVAMGSAMRDFGDATSAAFTHAIVEGENFRDTIAALSRDLQRLALNAIFRQLFSAIIGQPGAAGQAPSGLLGMMHGGGIVGKTSTPMRSLPAPVIASAPRFHGGLMPSEFPAVLKRGEGVFTPEQMKALGGSKVEVNIINNSGAQVQTQQRQEGGKLTLDVIVDQMDAGFAQRISQGRSKTGSAMQRRYGLNPAVGAI